MCVSCPQCQGENKGLCFAELGRQLPLSLASWGLRETGAFAAAPVPADLSPAATATAPAAAAVPAVAAEAAGPRRASRKRRRMDPSSKTLIDDGAVNLQNPKP